MCIAHPFSCSFGVRYSLFDVLSSAAQRLIPVFPHRFEATVAEDLGNLGWRTFIADLELAGGKLVFAILKFGRDDSAAHGSVQMFPALIRVTAGLGVTAGTHH